MPVPPPLKSSPIAKPNLPQPKSELGKKLLRRILDEGNSVALFDIVPDSLFPDELKSYEWIKKFYRKHKQLPSSDVAASNGHPLPDADSPIDYYTKRIHDRAIFNTINEGQASLATAMAEQDMDKAVQAYRATLSAVTALKNPHSYTTIRQISKRVAEQYEIAKYTPGLLGITSGYPTLDLQTTGSLPGDLEVIVARPGMGKTYVQLKMAHAAWKAGKRVAIITMEMVNEALVRRWIGVDASLNPDLIRRGQLDYQGEKIFTQTIQGYDHQDHAYFMAGNFNKSVSAVEEMIIQLDPDKIFIDAGYLLSPADRNGADGQVQLAKQVINELKSLGVSYGKPINVTVQFNRNVRKMAKTQGKGGTRFDLADIGGTDAVGQDADLVLGLRHPPMPYRDTHRIIEVMKIREGVAKDFGTKFNFWPMDFAEVELSSILSSSDDDEEENAEDADVGKKPAWMLS